MARKKRPAPPPPESPPAPPGAGPADLPVVGIGASAGGLDALQKFFAAMPPDSGIAFVLIVHLHPTQESLMAEVLSRHTAMKVSQVTEDVRAEADHVYVIPPGKYLAIRDGVLRLSDPVERRGQRVPIDFFFRSLAQDRRERGIGVILSGTGTEGTLGVREIHAQGGMVMVQDPDTAEHAGMPRSAIAGGVADYVLPVEEMPEKLLNYVRHSYIGGRKEPEEEPAGPDALTAILAHLRTHTRRDFRHYKKGTLRRRIERRMGLNHIETLPDYLAFLRSHPAEVSLLFKDLLIGVTGFFRDPEAWEVLAREFLRPLVQAKAPDAPLRAWVAGCATGEEAYSLALVIHEQLAESQKHGPVQIFATDINEQGLESCRAGVYPTSISADVSPERLSRFFVRLDDHAYQVSKALRESVAFAVQDLISDPPFSKLDLIVCRNLLIYLEPEIQKKVLGLFHFALAPGGGLFLGGSESIGRQDDLFEPINKKWHLYRRVGPTRRGQLPFPVEPGEHAAHRPAALPEPPRQRSMADFGRQLLLEQYAPACVLVNRKQEIVFLHGPTGRYLQLPSGEPALNLLGMAPDELGTKLRAALHRASREDGPASLGGIKLQRNGNAVSVKFTVRAVRPHPPGEELFLVTFEDEPERPPPPPEAAGDDQAAVIHQLEHELQATREDLQTTLEEVEAANEELKASNEEVMSINEELQSANEELETSKEELQSLNEELNTVNAQLRDKVEELEGTNNDLANLLTCTDVATLFLDTDFHIKRFTPIMNRLFNLIPSDVGRPISDISTKFADDDLLADARAVLDRLTPAEREVRTAEGQWYIRRILPYRTHENKIEGVVVTFTDVTRLRQAMDEACTQGRWQAVLADLGLRGLTAPEPRPLIEDAVRVVADALGVEFVEVLRLQEEGSLRLEAGVGWADGHVGHTAVGTGTDSQPGYTLQFRTPVLVEDYAREKRFRRSPLLAAHGAASGITVVIHSDHTPYGVLGAHTTRPRAFTQDEVHFLQAVANVLAQSLSRHRRDEELRQAKSSLEQRVEERTALMRLLRDVALAANEAETVEAALRYALRRVCEHNGWSLGLVYRVDERGGELAPTELWYEAGGRTFERLRQAMLQMRFDPEHWLPARVAQTRAAHWVRDINRDEHFQRRSLAAEEGLRAAVAFPVLIGRELTHVLEFFAREVLDPRQDLLEAMVVVGTQLGRVVERHRLQTELADAVWQEQQWLAQQLHDTVGQELTGLGMLARGLESQLRAQQSPQAEPLAEVVRGLQTATAQVRDVARGLFPVDLDEEGLRAALTNLAQATQDRHGIACTLEWDGAGPVGDIATRRHLYYIVQEAVTNAVKHSRCRRIDIRLAAEPDGLRLEVRDDGVGIGEQEERARGIGLRIMHYRASLIGARLEVRPAEGGGTLVSCTLGR